MSSEGRIKIDPEQGMNKTVIIMVVLIIAVLFGVCAITNSGEEARLRQTSGQTTSIIQDSGEESE